ncbi:circadian clock protein KaiB [Cyanobium sp. PCC 7001]|uniref:circadian clock protein KaiB n=1 Tax=Cyanobium sp. PCC 7001 TaxID=180281 RepID=UPI0001804A2C|nr:circadian clock protein KaiB [Cyanobium sp. PCC 7001]EDY38170.1 circadian clock protein KaiB [Cyanobium sp. PCC 7001]
MSPRKTYILKLYVAGNTPNSMRALKTLRNILEMEFKGVYALKVIDVLVNPQLAEEDKILATPTLTKILPPPVRRIIGDLSDRERVLIGLDLLYDELTDDEGFDALPLASPASEPDASLPAVPSEGARSVDGLNPPA